MRLVDRATGNLLPSESEAGGVPLVLGFVDREQWDEPRTLYFCRACRTWHVHGYSENMQPGVIEHRGNHCFNPRYMWGEVFILLTDVSRLQAGVMYPGATSHPWDSYNASAGNPAREVEAEHDWLDQVAEVLEHYDNAPYHSKVREAAQRGIQYWTETRGPLPGEGDTKTPLDALEGYGGTAIGPTPRKLTDGRVKRLALLLRRGEPVGAAAGAVGVSAVSVYKWLNDGQVLAENGYTAEEDPRVKLAEWAEGCLPWQK